MCTPASVMCTSHIRVPWRGGVSDPLKSELRVVVGCSVWGAGNLTWVPFRGRKCFLNAEQSLQTVFTHFWDWVLLCFPGLLKLEILPSPVTFWATTHGLLIFDKGIMTMQKRLSFQQTLQNNHHTQKQRMRGRGWGQSSAGWVSTHAWSPGFSP